MNEGNISEIQDFLWSMFDSDSFANKYLDELPPVLNFDTALVIDCSKNITDMNGYSYGTALLFLYAKPLESGMRNVKALKEMEIAVNDAIRNNNSKLYSINRRHTYSDYDASRNLNVTIIEINILI